jgi:ABC-type polysaccharide transport system permease subunit
MKQTKYITFVEKPIIVWFIFYAFGPICVGLLRSFYPDIASSTQHCITCSGLKPTTLTDYKRHSKLYIILTSDIYGLHVFYSILYHFMISYGKFQPINTLISILWSNLTRFTTLYSCNRNITLKMSGLRAETCRWKYHNRNTSVELSVMCSSSANSQV